MGDGLYGELSSFDKWVQYGREQADAHATEIINVSTNEMASKDAMSRLLLLARKSAEPVTAVDEAALSLTGVGLGARISAAIAAAFAKRKLATEASGELFVLGANGTKTTGTIAEGERLVYLSNSTAPRIRDRLSAAVSDVRTGLPREGNVAFAEVDVGALSSETMVMKAYSQFDNRVEEFLPKPGGDLNSWILKPQVSTSKYVGTTEGYLRDMDTEFKILETLAQRLGPNSQTSGRINLISEKMVCPSCTNIVNQFRERYPNIQLNIFTVEK